MLEILLDTKAHRRAVGRERTKAQKAQRGARHRRLITMIRVGIPFVVEDGGHCHACQANAARTRHPCGRGWQRRRWRRRRRRRRAVGRERWWRAGHHDGVEHLLRDGDEARRGRWVHVKGVELRFQHPDDYEIPPAIHAGRVYTPFSADEKCVEVCVLHKNRRTMVGLGVAHHQE